METVCYCEFYLAHHRDVFSCIPRLYAGSVAPLACADFRISEKFVQGLLELVLELANKSRSNTTTASIEPPTGRCLPCYGLSGSEMW